MGSGRYDITATCTSLRTCMWLVLFSSAAASAQITYTAGITGLEDDPALLETVGQVSDTLNMVADPPASMIHLRRRINGDEDRIVATLRSLGYYGAQAKAEIADGTPVLVTVNVTRGPAYYLRGVDVRLASPEEENVPLPSPSEVGFTEDVVATADAILTAEQGLVTYLRNHGYAKAEAAEREVLVDHAAQSVAVEYRLRPGPPSTFGEVKIAGLTSVQEEVIRKRVPWETGDTYNEALLADFQTELYDTGLFSLTSVQPATEVGPDGQVPIEISVEERKHRTYALGLRYDTDQGAGAEISWEHRNLKGKGHRLSVDGRLRTEVSEIELGYRIDQFHRENQSLDYRLRIAREDIDAYLSNEVTTSISIERKVTDNLTVGLGLGLLASRATQLDETRDYRLLYSPFRVRLDKSNDLLNPTRGYRLEVLAEPYFDFINLDSAFLKADAVFTHYLPFDKEEKWVLATRAHLGSLVGESIDAIPPSLRYYAGGGGSIRGYPFKTVSPLLENEPIGGRSIFEASIEIRRRISKTLGMVAFVDAGTAFGPSWPNFDTQVQYAAGIGARYFTNIGPMRFDIAVPLNRRDGIDDAFEMYLSIGQAF